MSFDSSALGLEQQENWGRFYRSEGTKPVAERCIDEARARAERAEAKVEQLRDWQQRYRDAARETDAVLRARAERLREAGDRLAVAASDAALFPGDQLSLDRLCRAVDNWKSMTEEVG